MKELSKTIQWGEDVRQLVEQFHYDPLLEDTIVFIHGGAYIWEEHASDYKEMAGRISLEANKFSLDYRLSPGVKDPEHLLDILHGFHYLFTNYKVNRLHIVGHSVGGFLSMQIQNHTEIVESGLRELVKAGIMTSSKQSEELKFLQETNKYWAQVQLENVIYLSGVFSFVEGFRGAKEQGVSEDYILGYLYVHQAFVGEEHYTNASSLSSKLIKAPLKEVKSKNHTILHSFKDEYVNSNQLLRFVEFLYKNAIPVKLFVDNYGKHFDILKLDESIELISKVLRE